MTKMLSASKGYAPPSGPGALPPDPRYRLVLRTRHGARPTTDHLRRLCRKASNYRPRIVHLNAGATPCRRPMAIT